MRLCHILGCGCNVSEDSLQRHFLMFCTVSSEGYDVPKCMTAIIWMIAPWCHNWFICWVSDHGKSAYKRPFSAKDMLAKNDTIKNYQQMAKWNVKWGLQNKLNSSQMRNFIFVLAKDTADLAQCQPLHCSKYLFIHIFQIKHIII